MRSSKSRLLGSAVLSAIVVLTLLGCAEREAVDVQNSAAESSVLDTTAAETSLAETSTENVGSPAAEPAAENVENVVTLTIDYGDGVQKRFPAVPYEEGTTVLSALQWADEHPRGVEFDQRGAGATTMIVKIDDLENGGADDRNWIFRVNGELADRSAGIFTIKAGDRILWKFERYK